MHWFCTVCRTDAVNKDLHWFCAVCRTDAVKNLKNLINLCSKQKNMITQIATLKCSVQELELNVNSIKIKSISRSGKWKEC